MLLSWVLVILLFFLPLLVIPGFRLAFETPKVILAQILIELMFVIWVVKGGFGRLGKLGRIHLTLIGVLVGLSLLHLFLNPSQDYLFGNVFRLQGVILLWFLILLSIIAVAISLKNIPKWIYFISFIGIFLGSILLGQNKAGRFIGTLGEPNALAATTLFILPFVFFASKKWLFRISCLIVAVVVVLISKSGSGLIGLTIISIFILLTEAGKVSLFKASIIGLLMLGLGSLSPFLGFERLNLASAQSPFKFESRLEIWQTAFAAGLKSPIIGHGFGNITQVLNQTAKDLNNNVQYQFIDSSHNLLLDFWVQGGILGLLSILGIIILALTNLIKLEDPVRLLAFLAVLTSLMFNPMSIGVLIGFWWLSGQKTKESI